MSNSGAKLSTGEYATRKLIDVATAIAVPVVTMAVAYTGYYHGEDIANAVKKKIKKIRNKRNK